ncbi:MAG: hypothetical protein OXI63_09955 [Candidatus Poribacteria bacterium]|nr:hypothetical protein [Candidatus Poribacteria bacterium]
MYNQKRSIGVNLAIFGSVLATVDINIVKKYAEIRRNTQANTPIKDPYQKPLTGLGCLRENAAINIVKKSAEIRRNTQAKTPQAKTPTGRYGFSKIDTYGAVANRTIGVNLAIFCSAL